MAAAIAKVTLADIVRFATQWRRGVALQGLFYGNIAGSVARSWSKKLDTLLQPGDTAVEPARVVKLENDTVIPERAIAVDHDDKAVILYVQGETDTVTDKAKMLLLRQLLKSHFYNQLRTEQQLGYIVFVTGMSLKEVPGSVFVVQSPRASVPHIQRSIEDFLKARVEQLPTDLSTHKQAVLTRLLEQPQTLSAMAERYWINILKDDRTFSYRQRLAKDIERVEFAQLQQYYQRILLQPARSYWLYTVSASNEENSGENKGNIGQISTLQPKSYYRYP